MRSTGDKYFSIPVSVAAPVSVLPRRQLRVSFPLPSHLLRALGKGEQPDDGPWSTWLAEWGWAWAVAREACAPEIPLVNLWLERGVWPLGFDARVLCLAVAMKLRVSGRPLSVAPGVIDLDLQKVWVAVSKTAREEVAEILALALVRADSAIFQFESVAPNWPADVGRVLAERRALIDDRQPAPVWLKNGYELIGENFKLLRSGGISLKDCESVWEIFSGDREHPLAFKMAFWWEATYCLTERHDYDAAERAQEKVATFAKALEALTGLVDPMWHHQQGRLYYYAGNYDSALAEFLREYKENGEDLNVTAMLSREIANALSDMCCLEAARHFAEKSVGVARSQGQKSELYKSLGRMAEIAIKLGDLPEAEELLSESLAIQDKLKEDNRSPGQTLTYLGHVALLMGRTDKAEAWYDRAARVDADKSSLAYIIMGRFSLAAAAGNASKAGQLWSEHKEEIGAWTIHQTHVLPAAVCTLAAARFVPAAKARLSDAVRVLNMKSYAVEAAYVLPDLLADEQAPIAAACLAQLNRWQKALGAFSAEMRAITGPLNGPARMAEAIRNSTLRNDHHLRSACYPMTLLAAGVPDCST